MSIRENIEDPVCRLLIRYVNSFSLVSKKRIFKTLEGKIVVAGGNGPWICVE